MAENLTKDTFEYPTKRDKLGTEVIDELGQKLGGLSIFSNSFKRGSGDKIFGSSQDGIWLGNAEFENAPFKVDMDGNMTAVSATITGFLEDGEAADDVNNNVTTIDGGKITANSVTASQIQANTITASEIAAGTITATQIDSNTITASEIAANTITASEIAANTITASEIAANTITASEIAAGTITATEINVSDLFAQTISATGSITGALLRTSSGSTRVELNAADNSIKFYSGGVLREEIRPTTLGNGGAFFEEGDIFLTNDRSVNFEPTTGSSYGGIGVNSSNQTIIFASSSDAIKLTNSAQTVDGFTVNTSTNEAYLNASLLLEDFTSNPTTNGEMLYFNSGGSEGLRMQFGGADFQFDATAA